MWSASAAAVPHEVCGATIEPSAVGVVRFSVPVSVEVMLYAIAYRFIHIQVVTLWHTASFNDPRCLVLALASLVDEALGARGGSLIACFLIFQLLVLLRKLFRLLFLVIIVTPLRPLLFLLILLRLSVVMFLFLLLFLVIFASSFSLLLRGRHGELVPAPLRHSLGVVPVSKVRFSPIILLIIAKSCRWFLFSLLSLLLIIVVLSGLLMIIAR